MNLTFQEVKDLMDVVGNRMDDLSDAGLAYTDDGDTDETKKLRNLYNKLKALEAYVRDPFEINPDRSRYGTVEVLCHVPFLAGERVSNVESEE